MRAGIIGATGYAGAELVRLLSGHPKIEKLILSSVSYEGELFEDIYPSFFGKAKNFYNKNPSRLLKAEDVIASSDVVFSALPHAVGEGYAQACMDQKVHYIDLSADFRFDDDEETYSKWYGKPYQFPDLHKKSIYGLPEMNRQKIKDAAKNGNVIIGNPGCYPTGATLGLYPALDSQLYAAESCDCAPIIINSVSGTSGGGREPQRSFHYAECADSIAPYKVASHRHSPEIERNVGQITVKRFNGRPRVIFTPHLAPMNRGILSTIYIPITKNDYCIPFDIYIERKSFNINSNIEKEIEEKTDKIRNIYIDFYKDEPFVRILPKGLTAATNRVRQSNFCDISIHLDINGCTLIVTTAIDNMVKGAAGQAVQNMNIIFGFEETCGLEAIPQIF